MPAGDRDDNGSPYLARPVRPLASACADLAGCCNDQQHCPRCRVAEICPSIANEAHLRGA